MISSAEFWNDRAEGYAKSKIRDMDAYEYTVERTRSYLSPRDRVLEIGCGTSTTALKLAPSVHAYTASDLSQKMVEIGAEKAWDAGIKNTRHVAADVMDPVLDDEPYDAILGFNILHLVDDTEAAIARAYKLLKPGGVFITKTVCLSDRGFNPKLSMMLMILPVLRLLGKAPPVRIVRVSEMDRMISAAGFEIIETGNFPAQPPSRFVVARKV